MVSSRALPGGIRRPSAALVGLFLTVLVCAGYPGGSVPLLSGAHRTAVLTGAQSAGTTTAGPATPRKTSSRGHAYTAPAPGHTTGHRGDLARAATPQHSHRKLGTGPAPAAGAVGPHGWDPNLPAASTPRSPDRAHPAAAFLGGTGVRAPPAPRTA
ncbi:hypothetical protein GCM10023317_30700 [Actinopolymorpha pittospori]